MSNSLGTSHFLASWSKCSTQLFSLLGKLLSRDPPWALSTLQMCSSNRRQQYCPSFKRKEGTPNPEDVAGRTNLILSKKIALAILLLPYLNWRLVRNLSIEHQWLLRKKKKKHSAKQLRGLLLSRSGGNHPQVAVTTLLQMAPDATETEGQQWSAQPDRNTSALWLQWLRPQGSSASPHPPPHLSSCPHMLLPVSMI